MIIKFQDIINQRSFLERTELSIDVVGEWAINQRYHIDVCKVISQIGRCDYFAFDGSCKGGCWSQPPDRIMLLNT